MLSHNLTDMQAREHYPQRNLQPGCTGAYRVVNGQKRLSTPVHAGSVMWQRDTHLRTEDTQIALKYRWTIDLPWSIHQPQRPGPDYRGWLGPREVMLSHAHKSSKRKRKEFHV